MKAFLLLPIIAVTMLSGESDPDDDYFANRPDYVLKEGSVGTPRVDVPWLRVTTASTMTAELPRVCVIQAVVVRSFDAINFMSHTEYIAEVQLAESDRSALRDKLVVVHGDRWNDLLEFNETNPFRPGSRWMISVFGTSEDDSSWRFVVEGKEAQPGATDNPDDAQRLREDH